MKLVIVATNLNRKKFWRRWLYLKEINEDIEIVILSPQKYEDGKNKGYSFGFVEVHEGSFYCEERFRVVPIKVKQDRLGGWASKDIIPNIKKEKPDVVYYIGVHSSISLSQTIKGAKSVGAKTYVFTMRGDLARRKNLSLKHRVIRAYNDHLTKRNVKNSDAIFVHYPDAITAFREEGYKGPLFINTQIGVDTSYFVFSQEGRDRVRKQLGLEGCYVFGSASRLNAEKGVLDIIEALPKNPKVKCMILGSGSDSELKAIKDKAAECGVEEQILMPGLIDWSELPDYLSAMDCAIHVPKRGENWVETFSLALVQEMSVGLPVIGSISGSVPYQIGQEDLLVQEGDVQGIREKMNFVIDHPEDAKKIGQDMRNRCINCFDVEHIAKCFGIVLKELDNGIYNTKHIDTVDVWEDIE